jgi:hypothetical protein
MNMTLELIKIHDKKERNMLAKQGLCFFYAMIRQGH